MLATPYRRHPRSRTAADNGASGHPVRRGSPHRPALYPDAGSAGDHVPRINETEPTALDAFHVHVVENLRAKGKERGGARLLPDGNIWLMVEFGGNTQDEASGRALDARQRLEGGNLSGVLVLEDAADQAAIWYIRESSVGASRVTNVEQAWPSWEDALVHPDRLGDLT